MTAIPLEAEPAEAKPTSIGQLIPDAFVVAAEQLGVKTSDALALGEVLLNALVLTTDAAPLLKGGRQLCADLLEQGLRAGPDGLVQYQKGRNKVIDEAITRVLETQFPTPTKTVRNEVALNGCAVWFSVADDAYWVEVPRMAPVQAYSAAGACALCDSGSGADSIYPDVLALRDTPTVTVPMDDPRASL